MYECHLNISLYQKLPDNLDGEPQKIYTKATLLNLLYLLFFLNACDLHFTWTSDDIVSWRFQEKIPISTVLQLSSEMLRNLVKNIATIKKCNFSREEQKHWNAKLSAFGYGMCGTELQVHWWGRDVQEQWRIRAEFSPNPD